MPKRSAPQQDAVCIALFLLTKITTGFKCCVYMIEALFLGLVWIDKNGCERGGQ